LEREASINSRIRFGRKISTGVKAASINNRCRWGSTPQRGGFPWRILGNAILKKEKMGLGEHKLRGRGRDKRRRWDARATLSASFTE